jgi:hypothetical protein
MRSCRDYVIHCHCKQTVFIYKVAWSVKMSATAFETVHEGRLTIGYRRAPSPTQVSHVVLVRQHAQRWARRVWGPCGYAEDVHQQAPRWQWPSRRRFSISSRRAQRPVTKQLSAIRAPQILRHVPLYPLRACASWSLSFWLSTLIWLWVAAPVSSVSFAAKRSKLVLPSDEQQPRHWLPRAR